MRRTFLAALPICRAAVPAWSQVGGSAGIQRPLFPQLVQVPGDPVHHAPQLDSNSFFFDGTCWLYTKDGWYASDGWNGT